MLSPVLQVRVGAVTSAEQVYDDSGSMYWDIKQNLPLTLNSSAVAGCKCAESQPPRAQIWLILSFGFCRQVLASCHQLDISGTAFDERWRGCHAER